jgi:OFA family oxalate/formate antiporter-like MFS transporter
MAEGDVKLPGGRWGLVVAGMIINLCLGTVYSWSVFKGPLQKYLETIGPKLTPMDMQWPFILFLAVFALAMPVTGKYIERYGPRKVAMIGGVLCGLGWLLAGFGTSIGMLTIMYGIIGGLGVGIAYNCPIAVSGRWFPDRRGLAVGLTVLGFGFSAFFTANIAGYLMAAYGVMRTFQIFGVGFIILIAILAMPLHFPPAGWKPAGWTPPAPKPGAAVSCEMVREEMLKSKSFYALWLCYFIGCLAGLLAISISAQVATTAGAAAMATMLVGFFAIFNGFGRPIFGSLVDKIGPTNTAVVNFVLIVLASVAIWQVVTIPVYIVAFAILWGCLGGWLAIAPASTAAFFGTGDYPRCYGVVFMAYGAGAIVGPLLAGYVATTTGSFINVFPYVVVLAIIGIIIAFLWLKHPPAPAK